MKGAQAPVAALDHLVVAGASLDECVQWCEHTLGVTPGPGGAHPLMGTRNRLLALGGSAFGRSYLELIAIDATQTPRRSPGQKRWFDLDDHDLQAALRRDGPRLIHFVARVDDAASALRSLSRVGPDGQAIDRGPLIDASRDTPAGRLEWRITVRDDGQRLFYGALPTLIQWGAVHPVDSMARPALTLQRLEVRHPRIDHLAQAYAAIGLQGLDLAAGPPRLLATLAGARGAVVLDSAGV